MRWSSFSEKWIRPIKNIFCIYGEKTIKFNYAGISASNFFMEIIIIQPIKLNVRM